MLALAPRHIPPKPSVSNSAANKARGRVVLLQGCAEPVLRPEFRAAATRLLNRAGYDVIFAKGEQCCGALVHHMGRDAAALDAARRNIDAWTCEIEQNGLTAIATTASGCGTVVKDYGFMLRSDPAYASKAARISVLTKDISELLVELELDLTDSQIRGVIVAYLSPCSLQHGQKVTEAPKRLLTSAGYTVRTPVEAHLCCGSAGTYNILQPAIAGQLGDRKVAHIERLAPDVIATGNIGCAIQIGSRTGIPVVHTVELLDWALGGERPEALGRLPEERNI
jgi:glycolate oxidase iron-sulfur subunit